GQGAGPGDGAAVVFVFFQAEGGIRARTVTGVQTCALPIFATLGHGEVAAGEADGAAVGVLGRRLGDAQGLVDGEGALVVEGGVRSEERRVGKGGRGGGGGGEWRGGERQGGEVGGYEAGEVG